MKRDRITGEGRRALAANKSLQKSAYKTTSTVKVFVANNLVGYVRRQPCYSNYVERQNKGIRCMANYNIFSFLLFV